MSKHPFKCLLAAALMGSCWSATRYPEPLPLPLTPDPAPIPDDAGQDPPEGAHTACWRACQRLVQLGCPAALPTPEGVTCTQVCTNAEQSGVVSFGPDCVAHSVSCAAAEACR